MAAPNIVNVSSIFGKTAYLTPSNTSAAVLLANSAGSNKVFKINSVMATNIDGSNAAAATVAVNTSASGGGTSYPVASTISVPANASLIVVDKSTSFYLEEDKSIVVTSGTASDISFVVSYEELS
jgi:hypothetical protein